MSVTLESLQEEIIHLKSDIHTLQRQQSSRRGEPGPKGDSVVGPAGRDMVLIVKTNTATNTIHVCDEAGNEKATLVAVPGPKGDSIVGPKGESIVGAPGKPGKDAPSLDEIVRGVLKAVKEKL